jgi:PPOX class probable F420-dependent enzyme
MLLTTFRKDGTGVATPVWTVPADDGRIGMWTAAGTGKEKRLRRDPRVTVQACSARGRVKPGEPVLAGTAEIVRSGPLFEQVQAAIRAKYGRMIPIVRRISQLQGRFKADQRFGDTVVLISVTGSPIDGSD